VIAERPLDSALFGVAISFQDDLGVRRDLQIHGLALHHLDRLLAEESREHHLVHVVRHRRHRGERHGGVRPDRDGDVDPPPRPLGILVVLRAVLVDLPVHPGRAGVIDLHPVHPAVAPARPRVPRENERECNEPSRVLRPALQDGERIEGRRRRLDDILARARLDRLRNEVSELFEPREHLELGNEGLGEFRLDEGENLVAHILDPVDFECEVHPPGGAESVDDDGDQRAFHVLEQEGLAAARRLHLPVGDLRDLEDRIDLGLDADELPLPIKRPNEF
jgi:hypothetical protein